MASLKKQSFLYLFVMAITLIGVILAMWWIFSGSVEAPDAEFQQAESEFETLEFDEEQINNEMDDLEKEIDGLETEWDSM